LEAIRVRGPDNTEIHRDAGFVGGVVSSELSEARGTGFAADQGLAVLFDGEIYNARGDGQSDADVVADLYRKHGRAFAGYLEGAFACAIWDYGEVLLYRDPVGIRPMYWGRDSDEGFFFSSHMRPMVGKVDTVCELLPGTMYSSKNGTSRYAVYPPRVEVPGTLEEAARKLRDLLFAAVEKRLEDGAVGAMLLSGGLDSSIIAAITKELRPGLPAFTLEVEGTAAPDTENARVMADYLEIPHTIATIRTDRVGEMVPDAVRILESFDEDCISGIISNLGASGAVASVTNCVLSGEGADELLGGYHLIKNREGENAKLEVMDRLLGVAYNTALQRLDRGMFGSSVNYRTPFLDPAVIAFASQVPVSWKVHEMDDGRVVEKYILREAFRDMLPQSIADRAKLRFAAGTGADDIMDQVAQEHFAVEKFDEETRNTPGGYYLNSPKELWYYRLFKEYFPSLAFEQIVGRWDPDK
ncbi:MAG: asparagine synthase-related protein, partial [Actinomycetota bacterium]|nr:asparagine synthase-related protein [Actinomycetota bacterium]